MFKITAKQLHKWYLEAIKELNPEDYNPRAEIPYEKLSKNQKKIDIYIAKKINNQRSKNDETKRTA